MEVTLGCGKREWKRCRQSWMVALGVVSLLVAVPVWANPDVVPPAEETALIQLFERVSPAVVSVVARRPPRQAAGPGQESRGSGFFIDREGHLLTNAHFLNKATQIVVILNGGQEIPARVAGLDLALNVALLKVDPPAKVDSPTELDPWAELAPSSETVPISPLGDSSRVQVGQRAIVISNPLGVTQTMGLGIISSLSPSLRTRTPFDPEVVFETDITLKSPHYTGSPAFNAQGEVIGISNVVIDDTRGLSFLLPINLVKQILPELRTRGWVLRPSLGVRGQILDGKVLELFKLPLVPGFLVEQVDERGPGAIAGLRGGTLEVAVDGRRFLLGGDIITAIHGQRILTGADFSRATALLKTGEAFTMTVFRQGAEVDLGVRMAALPE